MAGETLPTVLKKIQKKLPSDPKEVVGCLQTCLALPTIHGIDEKRSLLDDFVKMLDVRQPVIFPPQKELKRALQEASSELALHEAKREYQMMYLKVAACAAAPVSCFAASAMADKTSAPGQ